MSEGRLVDALERRQECALVIAFVDLMGYAAQCARVSDREVADVIDGYYEVVADRVGGTGGRVVKFMGDGALVVYDAADVDRAVGALLSLADDVHRHLSARGWPCHATIKIHLGHVVAGPYGARDDKRFDVIGQAVNTAAMLETTGVTLSAEAFAALSPATAARFKPHAAPVTYVRQGDTPRFRRR